MEMPDGTSAAFIGSHNITGFALLEIDRRFQNLQRIPGLAQTLKMLRKPE